MKKFLNALLRVLLAVSTGLSAPAQGYDWDTLYGEVTLLQQQGRYERAVVVAKEALQVAEQRGGPDHPEVATALSILASLYQEQGQYAQAEPVYRRSLAVREKALDRDHPDVAVSLNNLASVCHAQGQYRNIALIAESLIADGNAKAGVGASPIGAFPIAGGTYVYLGTGNMVFANQANNAPNTFGLGRGATLAPPLTVPTMATCMAFDFGFYSEEFPEFVGSAFNDTFDAFIDGAPFTRDSQGNRISINSVFGALPGYAGGTTYDAGTQRLRAQVEVTPGMTSVLSFTLNDVGDTAYDSAVFLDRVRFSRPGGRGCRPGADYPISLALSKTLSLDSLCGVTQAMTVAPNTEVYACYVVTNSGEYTLTRHSLSDSALGVVLADVSAAGETERQYCGA